MHADSINIPLSSRKYPGMFAIVDADDFEWLNQFRWHPTKGHNTFYAASTDPETKRAILMHRIILGLEDPEDEGDHEDGNGLNNRRSNLRLATHAQNTRNTRRRYNATNPYRGVYWHERGKKWLAKVGCLGINHHLGLFTDPKEAALARDAKARELFGEFAKLNFTAAEVDAYLAELAAAAIAAMLPEPSHIHIPHTPRVA